MLTDNYHGEGKTFPRTSPNYISLHYNLNTKIKTLKAKVQNLKC